MPRAQRSQQALSIVSYHYDAFGGNRTQTTEVVIADTMSGIEADPSITPSPLCQK